MAESEHPDRVRLREHFQAENSPKQWDKLWKENFLPWDRGTPNPALVDLLLQKQDLLSGAVDHEKHKRALVPGCGRGYDVILLASFGYDSVGVEGSESAVKACKELASGNLDEYPLQNGIRERGSMTFLKGDFFSKSWESNLPFHADFDGFDFIYDYTFFCALNPSLRPDWALRMSELLSPTGILVCLEFPLYKAPALKGPPWAVREEVYVQHLSRPGEEIEYDEEGYVVVPENNTRNKAGLVRKARWMPERTHEIGKDTDHISLWTHAV